MGSKSHRYSIIESLGSGMYGDVHKVIDTETGKYYAMKTPSDVLIDENEGIHRTILKEIATLKRLSHPNVLSLVQFEMFNGSVNMIFDLMDCDLRTYLNNLRIQKAKPSAEVAQGIFSQIMNGLNHCHNQLIMHRDLKPENILVQQSTNLVKIADFGFAQPCYPKVRPYSPRNIQSNWYRAPEVILGTSEYNLKVDIWSAGCILVELHTNFPVFYCQTVTDHLEKYSQLLGSPNYDTYPEILDYPLFEKFESFVNSNTFEGLNFAEMFPDMTSQAADLASWMLRWNPAERPNTQEILAHEYFTPN